MQHLCRCTCLRCAGQERVQGAVRGLRVRGRVRGWVGGEAMQFLSLRWCRCFGCRMRPLSHFPSFLFRNTLERELRWMCRVGDVISNTNLVGQYTVWLARAEGWMVSVGPASTDYIIILDVHDFVWKICAFNLPILVPFPWTVHVKRMGGVHSRCHLPELPA